MMFEIDWKIFLLAFGGLCMRYDGVSKFTVNDEKLRNVSKKK